MSDNDAVSITEFRERHGLPDTAVYALSPDGGNSDGVWVPDAFRTPRGWSWSGVGPKDFSKIGPDARYREGKAAWADLQRADLPAAEVIHATSTDDADIAVMLLSAAERMGPVKIVRHDGTVVFTPAPTTTEGPRFL